MKAYKIISNNSIKCWWCKRCSKAHNVLIKVGNESYCEDCFPKEYKGELVVINQNREVL